MSLTAYNFQFYSYNMPTHRPGATITHSDSMDVDDIDMSIPPPKPPRAAAVQHLMTANGNSTSTPNIALNHHQMPWTTSTPISSGLEAAQSPVRAAAASGVNYFTDSNETPKSIYPSGAAPFARAVAPVADMQLRPKLHVPAKSWSCELREKALAMSKRSSACPIDYDDDDDDDDDDTRGLAGGEKSPQLVVPHKSWSFQIRQKALEMSLRNAKAHEDAQAAQQQNANIFQTPPPKPHLKRVLINAGAYERIQQKSQNASQQQDVIFDNEDHNASMFTTPNANNGHNNSEVMMNETSCLDTTFTLPLNATTTTTTTDKDDSAHSVKDRICFFNTLTTNTSKVFINLLKNSKTQNRATVQNSSSANSSPFATPLKPKRWSTHLDLHLEPSSPTLSSANLSKSHVNVTTSAAAAAALTSSLSPAPSSLTYSTAFAMKAKPQNSSTTPTMSSYFASASVSSNFSSTGVQRKNSLRRKPSIEKSRRPILRQSLNVGSGSSSSISGSGSTSNGTKPQMHAVMEDLSLVMPVKLRVAEYERRIMMES